ncbi:MAG: FG-GAP-like repeat-containing protein [Saprospiraceae bacterium]
MKNLSLVFFLLPAALAAQFAPTPNWVAEQPGRVVALVSADLNGDGREDLLGQSDKFIFWAENDPADPRGYFRHERIGPTNPDVAEPLVAAADLDGDGDLDVVSGANHVVEYFPNLGQGRFGPSVQISAAQPAALEVADFSGDGLADVAATIGNDLVWFKNVAGGAFGPAQTVETIHFVSLFRAADVDWDGDHDLIFFTPSGTNATLNWLENTNGTGDFAPTQEFLANQPMPADFRMADFDGDDDLDMVGIFASKGLGWMQFEGLAFAPVQFLGSPLLAPRTIDLADANGDGLSDALVGTSSGVWFYKNIAPGFVARTQITSSQDPQSVVFSDQNMDGFPDIVAANNDTGQILRLTNNAGTGTWGQPTEANIWVPHLTTLAAGDLDGDGDADLVAGSLVFSNFPADPLAWFPNEGGSFRRKKNISNIHENIQHVECVDFDKDGDLDLYLVAEAVFWYSNLDGKGAFGSAQALNPPSLFVVDGGTTTDVDGDGYPDAVFWSHSEGRARWCRNVHGQGGTFAPAQVLATVSGAMEGATLIDLNGDGILDFAATQSFSSERIQFYTATAPGVFSHTSPDVGTIQPPTKLANGDLDGDGKPDLVICGSRQIALFLSRSNFTRTNIGSFSAGGGSVEIGDFDGDGDNDLIAGTISNWQRVLFFENLGLGQFTNGVKITNDNARCLAGADFDRDGDFDLAIGLGDANGSAPGAFIYWLSNGSISASPEPGESVSAVQIVPNPFSENLTIHPTSYEPCVFEMFDLTGRRVLSAKIPGGADWQIPTARLSDGLYLYNIVSATGGRRLAAGKLLKLN